MDADQSQINDIVLSIAEAIYSSEIIPEEKKDEYIEHIRKNGFSDELIKELQKIFTAEEESASKDIEERQSLIQGLEKIIAEETEKNDRTQAEIVVAVDNFGEKQLEDSKTELNKMNLEVEDAMEELVDESEELEEEKIREKLGISKK